MKNISHNIQKITVAYKLDQAFKTLFIHLKSPILQNKTSHVIYETPCNNCDNGYICLTIQYLESK